MNGLRIDENLPMLTALPTALPIIHSRQLADQPSDTDLWEYAQKHKLIILTKDADFSQRMHLNDPPPLVVHIRVGNLRRGAFFGYMIDGL